MLKLSGHLGGRFFICQITNFKYLLELVHWAVLVLGSILHTNIALLSNACPARNV
ncbi:protein of unknown function [Shewanella benthica]|uniref:Uncharacterized protein n=1 Tax=Shewanella benthica TaxID=43661 RepID=A0A330MA28_9GAMM|nr:protein of unknown function [Shewanella benthica]